MAQTPKYILLLALFGVCYSPSHTHLTAVVECVRMVHGYMYPFYPVSISLTLVTINYGYSLSGTQLFQNGLLCMFLLWMHGQERYTRYINLT